jgi:hypothetical protein
MNALITKAAHKQVFKWKKGHTSMQIGMQEHQHLQCRCNQTCILQISDEYA